VEPDQPENRRDPNVAIIAAAPTASRSSLAITAALPAKLSGSRMLKWMAFRTVTTASTRTPAHSHQRRMCARTAMGL
jgi:hypothetical protein